MITAERYVQETRKPITKTSFYTYLYGMTMTCKPRVCAPSRESLIYGLVKRTGETIDGTGETVAITHKELAELLSSKRIFVAYSCSRFRKLFPWLIRSFTSNAGLIEQLSKIMNKIHIFFASFNTFSLFVIKPEVSLMPTVR